jgi:hypothetical protein
MAIPTQGAFVEIYKKRRFYILAFSKDSMGSPISGHGKYEKHPIDVPDEALGASVRKCVYNRKPGHYRPHMYKEREAYLAQRTAFLEDREVESDADFNKNTVRFHVHLWDDRIEFSVHIDNPSRWEPHVTLPLDATDVQLGQALRHTYQYVLMQEG